MTSIHPDKFYRVLRPNDALYKAPGLVERSQTESGSRDDLPLYFTNGIGVLHYAYHWGTTVCEVTLPEGVEMKMESDEPACSIYSAPSIYLGKVQSLTGTAVSDLLRASNQRKILATHQLRDMMDRLEMKLDLDWKVENRLSVTTMTKAQFKAWRQSSACSYSFQTPEQQYEHDKALHHKNMLAASANIDAEQSEQDRVFPAFTPPTPFHRMTSYAITLEDVRQIARSVEALLVVHLIP